MVVVAEQEIEDGSARELERIGRSPSIDRSISVDGNGSSGAYV